MNRADAVPGARVIWGRGPLRQRGVILTDPDAEDRVWCRLVSEEVGVWKLRHPLSDLRLLPDGEPATGLAHLISKKLGEAT